jgi:hypothetical protein
MPRRSRRSRRFRSGDDADNVRLAEDGKTLLVGYGSGAIAILEAQTLQKTGEIKLSGHPEAFELDPGTARVFVNVPGGFVARRRGCRGRGSRYPSR